MKIVDIAGSELKACCKFHYRGHEISASTIFKPHNVEVSRLMGTEGISNPLHRADHIQGAIEWVDEYIKAQKDAKAAKQHVDAKHRGQSSIVIGLDPAFKG